MSANAEPLLACEPPCPVAAGRMGLLCTCGNAPKRLHAIFDRLDAQREADLSLPPGPDAHPDWCKCTRVCGGDQ